MRINRYIYKVTNLINGRIYVGKRSTSLLPELDNYKGSGKIISDALSKYGEENFRKEILAFRNSEDEIYALEALYVTKVQVASKQYYNLKEGGRGASKGKSNPMYGKPGKGVFNDLARSKSKASALLKVGNKNHFFGKKHSLESKSKISEKAKLRLGDLNPFFNKTHSKESKGMMSSTRKKLFQKDPDYSKKIAWSRSKGIYITPLGMYLSSIEASEALKLSKGYLVSICTDKNKLITGTKFHVKDIYKSLDKTWMNFGFGFESKLDRDYDSIKSYITKFNESLTNFHLIK